MEINIPVFQELTLKIENNPHGKEGYPTSRLQKGLLLVYDGQELAEEAVGFGVPVLKRGLETVFPGDIELVSSHKGSVWEVTVMFTMNLEERITRPGLRRVKTKSLYTIKNSLAALIRRVPPLRGLLTATSSGLRWMLGWETIYEDAGFCTKIKMTYSIHCETGRINVEAEMAGLPRDRITEIVVMNEQGGRHFDQYLDSDGILLRGKEIGCWDEVTAKEASFISSIHRLAFTLEQVKGARLFRGRELVSSRLAWSGFGYSFSPTTERFSYDVRIRRLP